jgi:hypothetical protein
MVEQPERGPERPHAAAVGIAKRRCVKVLAVEEERLPKVLGGSQVGTARGDAMARGKSLVPSRDEPAREAGPLREPAVAIARFDAFGDRQTLTYVRHPESAMPTLRCNCPSNEMSSKKSLKIVSPNGIYIRPNLRDCRGALRPA